MYIDADVYEFLKESSRILSISQGDIATTGIAKELRDLECMRGNKKYLDTMISIEKSRRHSVVRSNHAYQMMFVKNAKRTVRRLLTENGGKNIEKALENIQESIDEAKERGMIDDAEELQAFYDDVKEGKGAYDKVKE